MTIKNMILDWLVILLVDVTSNGIGLYSGIISGSHVLERMDEEG